MAIPKGVPTVYHFDSLEPWSPNNSYVAFTNFMGWRRRARKVCNEALEHDNLGAWSPLNYAMETQGPTSLRVIHCDIQQFDRGP